MYSNYNYMFVLSLFSIRMRHGVTRRDLFDKPRLPESDLSGDGVRAVPSEF